jgi:hypothetical protein
MTQHYVKSHTRNGKTIHGFWRGGGGNTSAPTPKMRSAKRITPQRRKRKEFLAENMVLSPAQMKKAKMTGSIIHGSGKVIYHDKQRNDFYTTSSWGQSDNIKKNGGKVERQSGGSDRLYFKKNSKELIKSMLG